MIKIENGGYVVLERLNTISDFIKIYKDITKNGFVLGGLMMSTYSYSINSLFVDEDSLKPYYNNEQQQNISIRQLKKQVKNSK